MGAGWRREGKGGELGVLCWGEAVGFDRRPIWLCMSEEKSLSHEDEEAYDDIYSPR